MKVSSYALGRPSYWDRNPVTANGGYYNTVGPHVTTTRWTVTNTASQKMFVDSGSMIIMRMTAATTAYEAAAVIQSPSGNSVLHGMLQSNTIGASTQLVMGGSILITPSNALLGVTYDNSTGGTILYALFAHVVQFDV
jgi:hypothetical protein